MSPSPPIPTDHAEFARSDRLLIEENFPTRSAEFMAGALAILKYLLGGDPVPCPYDPATAQHDAFHAGVDTGKAIWRQRHRRIDGSPAVRMTTAPHATHHPVQIFPEGAQVRIKPLGLVGKISGFAQVGINGQMHVMVDRPHGQGILRQHFDEDELELVE